MRDSDLVHRAHDFTVESPSPPCRSFTAAGTAPDVALVEPVTESDGSRSYRFLAPRGPNAWIGTAFDGATLTLDPDGHFALGVRTDQRGSSGLCGDWTLEAGGVRLTTAAARTAAGEEVWLDGYLDPVDGSSRRLDVFFGGGSNVGRVLARIRAVMIPVTSATAEPPRPDPTGTSVPVRTLAPAISALDTVWSEFDVSTSTAVADVELPALAGRLILNLEPSDSSAMTVLLATLGPIAPGSLHLAPQAVARTSHETAGRIQIPRGAGALRLVVDAEAPPLALDDVALELDYRPDDCTIHGSVTARTPDGRAVATRLAGRLRFPHLEELRNRLHEIDLRGSWRVAADPDGRASVPGAARLGQNTLLDVSADGSLTEPRPDAALVTVGFLRHARAEDLAVGLLGPPTARDAVVLRRDTPPVHLPPFDPDDAVALRHLAQAVLADGRPATARTLLDITEELLPTSGEEAWLSRAMLVNFQLPADFELRDHAALVRHLRAGVELRQRLLFEASPWSTTLCMLLADLEREASRLDDLDAGMPGVSAASEVFARLRALLDTLQDPGIDLVALTERTSSLVEVLRRASADLVDLGEAELDRDPDAFGPELLESRRSLVHDALPVPPGDPPPADLQEREEAFLQTLARRSDRDGAQRVRFLRGYETAGTLRLLGAALAAAAASVTARDLVGATRARVGSNLNGASNLTGYLEQWRGLLEHDTDRVQAMNRSQGFYEELTSLMLDIEAPRDALLASELGRARAFADLMVVPRGTDEPTGVTLASLDETISRLDTPAVEFLVRDDEVVYWLVDQDREATTHRLPVGRAELAAANTEFRRLAALERPERADRRAMQEVLTWLGERLWAGPLADVRPGTDDGLLVVPHGPLFATPFAALRDRHGHPLVERYALTLSPALHVSSQLQARPAARTSAAGPRCVCLVAPDPMPDPTLKRLDETRDDFGSLMRFYDPARVTVHSGPRCTIAALRADLPEADVLVFATHAAAVETDPLSSFIALTPADGHDGFLRIPHLAELEFRAELAILAACDTGSGEITSDGVIGLSRTFLQRGVSTLLMTLQPVLEWASLELVYRFHEHWRGAGRSPAAALRAAQRSLHEEFGDQPHLWAPFVLFGRNGVEHGCTTR